MEKAIDLAAAANKVANGESHAQVARVYTPSRSADGASPTSNRKVMQVERMREGGRGWGFGESGVGAVLKSARKRSRGTKKGARHRIAFCQMLSTRPCHHDFWCTQVRVMKARTLGEDDSNEKYGARDRSGNMLRMLAIYFGVETAPSSRLPLPVSIQVVSPSISPSPFPSSSPAPSPSPPLPLPLSLPLPLNYAAARGRGWRSALS